MAVDEQHPGPMSRGALDRLLDVGVGSAAVGVTLTVGQAVSAIGQRSGFLAPPSSPVTALGNAFISITPDWLSEWAIRSFGVHDKQVLLGGVFATFVVVALLLGFSYRRHPHAGYGAVAVLVTATLTAVWSNASTGPADGLPTVIGSALGVALLVMTRRRAVGQPPPPSPTPPEPEPAIGGRRRAMLGYLLASLTTAVMAGIIARLIPTTADVEASRNRIRIGRVDPAPVGGSILTRLDPPRSSGAPPSTTTGTTQNPSTTPASAPAPTSDATPADTPAIAPGEPFGATAGVAPFITPNVDFYRIDTTLSPPLLRAEDWSLRIHGRVAREIRLNYQQLTALPQLDRTITLGCVSNPVGGHLIGNAVWTGARLDDLLAQAGPLLGADCVLSTSIDGFTCSTPLGALIDGRDALLAVGMNGEPLPIEHGFPVRMIVPGLFGYASATKWVVDLEVTTFASVTAYWTARGYARLGPVKIASRIDAPAPYTPFAVGDVVTVAGVAWAQHTGIVDVQVRIDDGPWASAEVEATISPDTWRRWRHRWTAIAGTHTVQCRAVDAQGRLQSATIHDPLPDGATGYAGLVITVT